MTPEDILGLQETARSLHFSFHHAERIGEVEHIVRSIGVGIVENEGRT